MNQPNNTTREVHRELSCRTCPTRCSAEWGVLGDAEVERMDRAKVVLKFLPGEALYHQGNESMGIYSIESGTVGIRKSDPMGHTMLLRLAHAGETIGYSDFLAGEVHTASAVALQPSEVCFIDRLTLHGLLDGNPQLLMAFVRHSIRDLDAAKEFILRQAWLPVRARLAHVLLSLRERFASVQDDGTFIISLPLSRQDLADLLGTRPETITRILQQMQSDGVLSVDDSTLVVPDLDNLLNEVESVAAANGPHV